MGKFACYILVLGFVMCIFSCAGGHKNGAGSTTEILAIHSVLADQEKAWNHGDLEGYMQGYWKNDSLSFIGKSGITYGWQPTLNNYKRSYPDAAAMGKLTFRILHTELQGPKSAYVTGKWHLGRTAGNLQGHFSLLLKKINNRWVIVSDHSS
jgi:ketosteroid isomerase-like protein